MRVLVWGINYAPEFTGIGPCNAALCEHLRAVGHEVEMVTAFPYYPWWRKRAEDRGAFWCTELIHGVPVHRCWLYVPAKVGRATRILHELSFVATSFARVLLNRRADVIIAVSPPLLLGPTAWLACFFKRARYLFHVQDLQPDAALGLGMVRPGAFAKLLYAVEAFTYRKAWKVSGISAGMLAAFRAKGVPAEKLVLFPNGVRFPEGHSDGSFRVRHGFSASDFLAVYSGNIGVKQGLEILAEAAPLLGDPRVHIVICGDGANREAIAAQASGIRNLHVLALLPEAEYQEMLAESNVALITQQTSSGRAFFPSKLLSVLAAGLPVLAVADEESELARVVREARCGVHVLPGRPAELARALDSLAQDLESLAVLGEAGRNWVSQFERDRVLADFSSALFSPK